jgi:hypothetical protein
MTGESPRAPRTGDLTTNQRRSVRRRNVGSLDDGRTAFLVRPGDTEEMARAVLDAYDPDLGLDGQLLAEWCAHTSDYAYRHGCGDWCENPSSRMVWVSRRLAP